jgi:Flp pilus assembly protein TadD
VLLNLAKRQYDNGNFDDCRKTLDDALKLTPESAPVHLMSARLSVEQGKLEPAELELRKVRELDEKNAEADYLSGVIYQRWQKPDAALEFYTKASEKAPAELPYLMARAEMLVALDQRGKALEILQDKLNYFENSAAIRDAVGQLLAQGGKYALAARVLKQASILAPDEPGIKEHLALALYHAKEFRQAADVLEALTKEERYRTRADLLAALGECQLQIERPRDARDNFELAAQLQPGIVTNWLNLGKAGLQLNDVRRAELSLRKAMSLDGQNAEVHLMLGYLRVKQNRLPEALSSFRQASILDPKDPTSLCMAGYVLEKQGKSNEAMALYARALRIKPGDELAQTLMAQVQVHE